MAEIRHTVGQFLGGQFERDWESRRGKLDALLLPLGLTGDESHESLYVFPSSVGDSAAKLEALRSATANDGQWAFAFLSNEGRDRSLVAFPVAPNYEIKSNEDVARALFIDVHSRLVAWWLTNAWRSQQLAKATWGLGDGMQIIPAATCARSLLETSAALWVAAKKLRSVWIDVKREFAANGIQFKQYHEISVEIWKVMWGSKFDDRAPDLKRHYSSIQSPNVLTLMDKLAKACAAPIHEHYQWLCNAVHPSIGGMLTFAGPLLAHKERTAAMQSHAPFPIAFVPKGIDGEKRIEDTIERALVSAAVLSVDVLTQVLDDTLRFIDDVALTTRAPQASRTDYWRCLKAKPGRTPCPCRSGLLGNACQHTWRTEPPPITERFETVPGVSNL